MELALAGAGAAVGGWAFGSTGAAVGWLVGSWLFSMLNKQDNQEKQTPPAAQPFLNSVQRGDTMPVFFGTNRVPSQNVWQANFNAIRQDSPGASGGKMGGSGGGKGGKTGSTSNTGGYTYKWDLIYHLGMVPEPYSLFGGWLGTERLSPSVIAAITQKFTGPTPFTSPTLVATGNASISYDEAVYFPGDNPSSASWSHFESIVGQPVKFPSTAWLGFKQLVLGNSPNVPQLFWEIGPGGAAFSFNPAYLAKTVAAYDGTFSLKPSSWTGLSAGGQLIWFSPGATDVYGANPSDLTIAWHLDLTVECNSVASYFNLTPVSGTGHGPTSGNAMGIVGNGKYLIVIFTGSVGDYSTIPFQADYYFGMYDLSGTTPNLVSIVGAASGDFVDILNNGTGCMLTQANNQTDDDTILWGRHRKPVSGEFWELILLPSINGFLALSGQFYSNLSIGTNRQGRSYPGSNNSSDLPKWQPDATYSQDWGGLGTTNPDQTNHVWGWEVPSATVGVGITYGTLLHFYCTRGIIQKAIASGSTNGYINSIKSTYPNGAMIQYNLGTVPQFGSNFATAGAFIAGLTTTPNVSVINSDFVDTSGNPVFPFTDANKHRDGSASTLADYRRQPSIEKITSGSAAGAYVVAFTMPFKDAVDKAPTGHWINVRVMVWNPLLLTYEQVAYQGGALLDTVTGFGIGEAHRYDVDWYDNFIYYDQNANQLYWYGQFNGSGLAPNGIVVSARFGGLSISGGADVTPPYIIYQILVNDVFGIGAISGGIRIDPSKIDQTSYQAVSEYCTANNILVSTQYRNPSDFQNLVEMLLAIYGGYLVISGGQIKFGLITDSSNSLGPIRRVLDNSHFVVSKLGDDPITIQRGSFLDTYNKVKVNYIDRSIQYNNNYVVEDEETDQDLNGIRMKEFPPNFVMSEATARQMAVRALFNNLYARDSYTFKLSWKDADLEPGDVVTLVDSYYARIGGTALTTNAMITNWEERQKGTFDVTAQQVFDSYLTSSSSPLNVASPSQTGMMGTPLPAKTFTVFELPQEYQAANPYVFVAWAPPPGAVGATVYVSPDNSTFAPLPSLTPYPLTGQLIDTLAGDERKAYSENVDLVLFPSSNWSAASGGYDITATMPDISVDGIGLNAGVLWCGSEALAYTGLTLVSQNRYKAARLYRGWGGTNIQNHSSGDYWYKLGGGIGAQVYNIGQIGTTIYIKVAPFPLSGIEYNVASVSPIAYTIKGAYYRPQIAPALSVSSGGGNFRELKKFNVGGTGDINVEWQDSARQSGYGANGYGNNPGGYGAFITDTLSHAWRVEVVGSGGVVVRSTTVSTAYYSYPNATNASDNGAWRGNIAFKVTPFSPYGDAPRTSVLSLELF